MAKAMRLWGNDLRNFRTFLQCCAVCHGITPCHEYSYEDLLGLYKDYRQDSYNKERSSLEPGYRRIAEKVGSDQLELKVRNSAVESFLQRNAACFTGGRMIDYGGSDGRFIPPFALEHFDAIDILDASEASIHSSVENSKVKKIAETNPQNYAFVTCMHVLEHVGNPRAFIVDVLRLLRPGGLIYIEVPLELNLTMREACLQRVIDPTIEIHEHINKYDRTSIRALIDSIEGVEMIDDEEGVIDLGWCRGLVGRFLARMSI